MTNPNQAQVVVQLTPAQAAARELAEELAANKELGIDFGSSMPEGGRFMGTDGQLHNAHGELVDEDGTVLEEQDGDRGEAAAEARAASANDDSGQARKSSARKRSGKR